MPNGRDDKKANGDRNTERACRPRFRRTDCRNDIFSTTALCAHTSAESPARMVVVLTCQ